MRHESRGCPTILGDHGLQGRSGGARKISLITGGIVKSHQRLPEIRRPQVFLKIEKRFAFLTWIRPKYVERIVTKGCCIQVCPTIN